ncbi:Uncharacterised protein [Mycobacteroides abscessus subsp. abscessus]|nr:Uncharacterised protein [Mycobacteroides abscessus subsp. abscessus]SIL50567.1 Uncharacterised protein [Mycobacteroides abscessus subsp. abscessus]SKY87419.1 Uncharacterised protein [Mycobacteroides abscessus subsp. abscessus]
MGTSPPSGPSCVVKPNGSTGDDALIGGSIWRGMEKNDNSSSSQSRVSRFINMVRLAFVTSVTCTPLRTPPVRFQITQLSGVPKSASPFSASRRTPSTFSRIHCSFPPEK